MNNPFYKNLRLIYAYALFWLIISISHFLAVQYYGGLDVKRAVIDSIVFNFIFSIIGVNLTYPVNYIQIKKNNLFRIFLYHKIAGILTILIWLLIGSLIALQLIPSDSEYNRFLMNSIPMRIMIGYLFYTALVSLYYVMIYFNDLQEKEKEESELKSLIKEAELKALKFQINPHFIFNSLNSIASLTISAPERARDMTIKLSEFLRYSFAQGSGAISKLAHELENVRKYLEIEKVRFGNKIIISENIQPECLNFEIPSLILQPIAENAVKYGVYESVEPVVISLSTRLEEKYLSIYIANNYDINSIPRKGSGVGLKYVKERLRLTYNIDGLLETKNENGMFEVQIFVPIK